MSLIILAGVILRDKYASINDIVLFTVADTTKNDPDIVHGIWKESTTYVNTMVADLTYHVRYVVAQVSKSVARNESTKTATVEDK